MARRIQQFYIADNKPASNSARDLFEYCVEKAMEKDIFSEAYMHNQWANLLFGYEKNSSERTDLMSKVKREYSTYFTHTTKYAFDEEKIKRDFPYLFGIDEDEDDGDYTTDSLVRDTIKAINKEIIEQQDPQNLESFKGSDLTLIRQQGNSYIYQVRLTMNDGQEPNIHESIPFVLKVYDKEVTCEAVDFDFITGVLFFTTNRRVNNASYCKVLLDSTFILDGLKKRLEDLKERGINEDLPFAKFLFEETDIINEVPHKSVPLSWYEHLDKSQKKAFLAALDHDFSLIWGPPGTGKSFTLASIIYALYKLGEERTVVCCLSNVAVDQLLCKLLDILDPEGVDIKPGNIYRAGRSMDSRVIGTDYLFPKDEITQQLREAIKQNQEKIKRLKELKLEKSEKSILLKAENKELREKLREHTEFLVKSSRLVFSTISNFVLSTTLYESKFDNLIVDEASMMAMPSLLALGHNISKRLILVGDFQQLSPISIVKDDLLQDSVFEMSGVNITNTNHPALKQLLSQRRSHKKIVDLINKTFYQGKLIPTANPNDEIIYSEPYPGRIIALKKVSDGAVRYTKGGTRQNKVFAENIIDILDELSQDKDAVFSIGIITPYKGQVSLLRALKYERKYDEKFDNRIKIGTIHTFQGSECDIIIFDMVDCFDMENGRPNRIGRLYSGNAGERLLNVAVSRARHKLIVVCDPEYIKNIPGNTLTTNSRSLFNKLSKF
ncbi:MAG: AAA family ATPase [Prevotella sp.]|nr:AAA family ATPase [Prevotella sp.]